MKFVVSSVLLFSILILGLVEDVKSGGVCPPLTTQHPTSPPTTPSGVEEGVCIKSLLLIKELVESEGDLELLVLQLEAALQQPNSICIINALPQIEAKVNIVVGDVNDLQAALNNVEQQCSNDP